MKTKRVTTATADSAQDSPPHRTSIAGVKEQRGKVAGLGPNRAARMRAEGPATQRADPSRQSMAHNRVTCTTRARACRSADSRSTS